MRRLYRIETWDRERGVWVADSETWTNRDRVMVARNRRMPSFLSSPTRVTVVGTGEVISPQIAESDEMRNAPVVEPKDGV